MELKIPKLRIPNTSELEFFIEDKTIMRQRIYVGVYVILITVLLINAFIGRRTEPINVTDTKIGEAQPMGDGTTQVKLTSSRYNPKKNLVEMDFTASSSSSGTDSTAFTGREIKFDGVTSKGAAKLEAIPTINNHWTVVISNLDKNFGAVEIKAISNMPKTDYVNGTAGSTSDENLKPKFGATQKHMKHDNHLTYSTPQKLAIDVVDQELSKENKSLKTSENKLKSTQDAIEFKMQQISDLKENMDKLTTTESDNVADTIGDLNEQIDYSKDNVNQIESDIQAKKKTITELEQKRADIVNGEFDVTTTSSTKNIKPKSKDD